jgi:type VI secretion system protein ImpE
MSRTAQELVRQGLAHQALTQLQQEVRAKPDEPRLRVFLFQLLCVLGQWQRALAQLELCGELDASHLAMVATYRDALQCEAVRAAVFAGRTTPIVFGEPQPWVAQLVHALQLQGQGQGAPAAQVRAQALRAAPARPGRLNGTPFTHLVDADARLGPVLELVLNGRYGWMPFDALQRVVVEAPRDLRDLLWAPAHLEFVNGGEAVALIPVRYPETTTAACDDDALLMSRMTTWLPLEPPEGLVSEELSAAESQFKGLGQRVLATEHDDLGLLELRELVFDDSTLGAGTVEH